MNLGASVDMDDTHIVVGEVGAYNRASAAYVLTYSGDMLTQTAKLTPSDGGLGDYFGRRVKISGDYIAVQGENDSTGDAQVYIFNLSGASWSEQDTIVIPDYGYLDGLDGDTLIVSDRYADEGGGSDSGAVYVYVRSGSSWAIQATLEASDSSPNLQFGHSAVLNGDYIFASGANNVTYVFKRTGTSWSEISWIIPPAGTLEPAVSAVSGDMKYVAVFGKEDNPDYYDKIIQHKLFMFELGAPDTWEYTQMLTPSLEEDAYTFSWSLYRTSSVAMDNGYLVAGSALSDDDIADRYLSVYSLPSSEGE